MHTTQHDAGYNKTKDKDTTTTWGATIANAGPGETQNMKYEWAGYRTRMPHVLGRLEANTARIVESFRTAIAAPL